MYLLQSSKEDKVYIYKALRLELYPNSLLTSSLLFNMFNPFFPQYHLIITDQFLRWNRYWIPTENLYLSKSFRRPIFFKTVLHFPTIPGLQLDPVEIRCRIFSFHKGLPLLPYRPTNMEPVKIKRTGGIQYSRHFSISFHLFLVDLSLPHSIWLWCPKGRAHDSTQANQTLNLEEDEVEELSCRQSTMPRNPRVASPCPY